MTRRLRERRAELTRLTVRRALAAPVVVLAVTLAAFALAGASPLWLTVFVILEGAGYGVTAISRPVVAAAVLGRDGFGAISGALALPFIGATALAPTFGAVLWSAAGYDAVQACLLGLLAAAAVSFSLAIASSRRR